MRVTLSGERGAQSAFALVDSGSEHVIAAPWLREAIGAQPDEGRGLNLGIGGDTVPVQFARQVTLSLSPPPDHAQEAPISWTAEVGFPGYWRPPWPVILGQTGFFDEFTVTMHRGAQALAVEKWSAFD